MKTTSIESDLVIKEHTPNELSEIGLKHKLHVQAEGWQLKSWLETPSYLFCGRVAYYKGVPIGISVLNRSASAYNVGVYVKKEYRRYGIGTALVKGFATQKYFQPCKNTKEQKQFWKALESLERKNEYESIYGK